FIHVPDVNVVLVEGNAKWPFHSDHENFALLRSTGMLRIAQHDNIASSGVGQENVSIRRYSKPPRPLEVLRKEIHAKALRHRGKKPRGGFLPVRPVPSGFRGIGWGTPRFLPVGHLPLQYGWNPKSDG